MSNLPIAENSFDKIRKAFVDGTDAGLSADLKAIKARWQSAYSHLSTNFNTEKEVVRLLASEFRISMPQAYRDVKAAKLIFGDIKETNEAIERHFASEMAKEMFKLAMQHWKTTKKATYFYAMVEQQKLHMKVNRLDKQEIEFPDMMDVPRQEQVLQLSPEFLNKYGELIDKKVLNSMKKVLERKVFKDYLNDMAEDVEFIEVDDGSDLEAAIKTLRKLHEQGVNMKAVESALKDEFDG